MELLEDADGMIRDAAKSTVIELFRCAAVFTPEWGFVHIHLNTSNIV